MHVVSCRRNLSVNFLTLVKCGVPTQKIRKSREIKTLKQTFCRLVMTDLKNKTNRKKPATHKTEDTRSVLPLSVGSEFSTFMCMLDLVFLESGIKDCKSQHWSVSSRLEVCLEKLLSY